MHTLHAHNLNFNKSRLSFILILYYINRPQRCFDPYNSFWYRPISIYYLTAEKKCDFAF